MFPSVFVGYDLLSYLTNYAFMLISFQLIIAHLMYYAVQCSLYNHAQALIPITC